MKRDNALKRWKRRAAFATASAALALALAAPASAEEAEPLEQVSEVFELIEGYHLSATTDEKLRDAAIRGMIESLNDPYTQYYDEAAWDEMYDSFEQTYVGIGIRFAAVDEGLLVLRVYEGSAAAAAGLRVGDVVVGVAGATVQGKTTAELRQAMLGPEGTSVSLDVRRVENGETESVSIVRKPFHIPTAEHAFFEGGVGYVRMTSFSSDTSKLVGEALAAFEAKPSYRALVIDLRGNPGGYLDAVRDIASNFVESGTLLRTVDRSGKEQSISVRDGRKSPVPVTLIVDEQSASASEVFAGALQDYGLATVVGAKTYGKGSVQRLIPLETGGGLRLTIQEYLTPNGRKVNGVGIAPDVAASTPTAQTMIALREAGLKRFRVEMRGYETIVNGVVFDFVVPTVRENGRAYVSAAALAALADGAVAWDGAARAVSIQAGGKTVAFREGDGLLLRDGSGLIDAASFARAFPHVQMTTSEKTIVAEVEDRG